MLGVFESPLPNVCLTLLHRNREHLPPEPRVDGLGITHAHQQIQVAQNSA